jgi:IS5 family transposase
MYTISDDELEFPVHDRISFMEFLGLGIEDHIPDAKTVWLFRAHLAQHDLVKEVFAHLDNYLRAQVLNLATKLYISRQVQRDGNSVRGATYPAPSLDQSRYIVKQGKVVLL